MITRLFNLHRDEDGEVVQNIAIIGVAVLLLLVFQGYGNAAMETVNNNITNLLGGGGGGGTP